MVNFQNTFFVKSCTSFRDKPLSDFNEVLLVGRSNVGKSTLINVLTNHKSIAKTSKTGGKTKLLNYFNVDNKFFLVDSPGYGGANVNLKTDESFRKMMEDYFNNKNLKYVLFLLDSRRKPNEDDEMFFEFLKNEKIKFCFVFTKCDKLNQKEKSSILKNVSQSFKNINDIKQFFVSSKSPKSFDDLKKVISRF